jgi:iron complex outermembrane receptor protein
MCRPAQIGGALNATTTNAVFGELTYPVTDRARVIVGARQSYDKRELRPAGITTASRASCIISTTELGGEFDVTPTSMALRHGRRPATGRAA